MEPVFTFSLPGGEVRPLALTPVTYATEQATKRQKSTFYFASRTALIAFFNKSCLLTMETVLFNT